MAATREDDDGLIASINVTPLVDVVLVLLVVLMVTASYIAAQTIPLNLPKAASGESTSTSLAISIDARGRLWLEGEATTAAALRTTLRQRGAAGPVRVLVAADADTTHRNVVRVLDLLRQEGIHEFAINVQPADLGRGD
ncbi:MAG: biopolymer transporter ExbD [Polyangiaceae bacterium]